MQIYVRDEKDSISGWIVSL